MVKDLEYNNDINSHIDKSQEEEMPKAERKKLLKIVQQFLKSIKSKEKRKKTKKVLTKIAKQAKVSSNIQSKH